MLAALPRRLAAEAVGTALLVAFGPGSVVAAVQLGEGSVDYAGLGMIALCFGFVVSLVIWAFGSTSGAHINPAVTVALAAVRRFPAGEVLPYIAAQLVGAVLGALAIVAVFGATAARAAGVGLTQLGTGVGIGQGIAAEALGTLLLLVAVMALAVDTRAPAGWAGFGIGLAVAVEVLMIGPVTGGSVNPARTLGPYAVAALIDAPVPWSQYAVYVVGPLLGALLGAFGYDALARPRLAEDAAPEPVQGAQGEVTGRREPLDGPGPAPTGGRDSRSRP